MKYAVITGPNAEPIPAAHAKEYLRIVYGAADEDYAVILPLISAAREYCENYTGRSLAVQTIEAYPERFARVLSLPRPPLVAVTLVEYTDRSGVVHTLDDYSTDTVGGRVIFSAAPNTELREFDPIKITYTAGYSKPPDLIRQAMLLLIGHWYANREAVVVGDVSNELELSVGRILNQYKTWWF